MFAVRIFISHGCLSEESCNWIFSFFKLCNLQDLDELMSLAPEKILLKWMNFQLKKGGYSRTVTNFSSDVKVCAKLAS